MAVVLAEGIEVAADREELLQPALARAYQDAVWRRTKIVQELRARLLEYYPGFLTAFAAGSGSGRGLSTTQLASTDTRAVLAIAPGPQEGLKVSKPRVETAASRRAAAADRQPRGRIIAALRVPQLRQDPIVETAMRTETLALLACSTRSAPRSTSSPRLWVRLLPSTRLRDHYQFPWPGRRL